MNLHCCGTLSTEDMCGIWLCLFALPSLKVHLTTWTVCRNRAFWLLFLYLRSVQRFFDLPELGNIRLPNNYTLNYMHSAFSWPLCAFLCPLVTTPRGSLPQMVINEVTWLHGAVTHAVTGPVTSSIFVAFYFGFFDAIASGFRQVPAGFGPKQPPLHSAVEDDFQ